MSFVGSGAGAGTALSAVGPSGGRSGDFRVGAAGSASTDGSVSWNVAGCTDEWASAPADAAASATGAAGTP